MNILHFTASNRSTLDFDRGVRSEITATSHDTASLPADKKSIFRVMARSGLGYASSGKPRAKSLQFDGNGAPHSRLSSSGITVKLIAGQAHGSQDSGQMLKTSTALGEVRGLAVQYDGTVWVCDAQQHALHRITPEGTVSTLHSRLKASSRGAQRAALFSEPDALCLDEGTGAAVLTVGQPRQGQLLSIDLHTPSEFVSLGTPPTTMKALYGDGSVLTHAIIPACLAAGKPEAGKPVLWVGELNRLRKIFDGKITTVISNTGLVTGLVVNEQGDLFALMSISLLASKIVKISGANMSFVAGGLAPTTRLSATDTDDQDGKGEAAVFTCAAGLTINKTTGHMYLCSHGGLRQITPEGVVTTLVSFSELRDAYPANTFAPIDFMACTGDKRFVVASQSMVHSVAWA